VPQSTLNNAATTEPSGVSLNPIGVIPTSILAPIPNPQPKKAPLRRRARGEGPPWATGIAGRLQRPGSHGGPPSLHGSGAAGSSAWSRRAQRRCCGWCLGTPTTRSADSQPATTTRHEAPVPPGSTPSCRGSGAS
jgi:hypothetical protein